MAEEEENPSPPRFRVVDKRISARPDTPSAPSAPVPPSPDPPVVPETPTPQADPAPPPSEPPGPAHPSDPSGSRAADEDLWTPEQEAEARRFTDEIGQRAALEWVVNASVTLANVAGVKLDLGQVADAQIAIDAFAAIVDKLGPRLGETEALLRQTLAQLQLAYAERAALPKQP